MEGMYSVFDDNQPGEVLMAKKVKEAEGPMKRTEFKELFAKIGGVSAYAHADALGVSVRQAQRFAKEKGEIPEPVRKLMRLAAMTGTTVEDLKTL